MPVRGGGVHLPMWLLFGELVSVSDAKVFKLQLLYKENLNAGLS